MKIFEMLMSRKSLTLYGESAGIRTQDPRLKRASQPIALTRYAVRLVGSKALLVADLRQSECEELVLGNICNRDRNRAQTVTKTVTSWQPLGLGLAWGRPVQVGAY